MSFPARKIEDLHADGATNLTAEQVREAAMSLSPDQREDLAEALFASLPTDPEDEAAWTSEIARRIEDLRTGKAKLIPAEDVFREAEDLLR